MAFVEQRGNRLPLPAPDLVTASAHTLQQPMLTQQPVAPPHASLYHLRPPAFCPRCYSQFNGSFTLGGMCPNCSCVLPNPQLALRPPPLPQPMVPLPFPAQHSEPRHDDHFLMTDMLHVIDDVLKEQEDVDHMTGSSSPAVTIPPLFHAESARQCQCGSKEAVMFCSVRQLFVCSVCMTVPDTEHSTPLLSPAPHHSTGHTAAVTEDRLRTCSTHDDQKASLFCHTCLSTVCASCAQSDHPGHAVIGVSEAYTRYRSSMEQLLSKNQVEIKLLELSRSGAEKMRESVGEKQVLAVERVKQIFKEHRALLDKREQEVRHTTVVAD